MDTHTIQPYQAAVMGDKSSQGKDGSDRVNMPKDGSNRVNMPSLPVNNQSIISLGWIVIKLLK